MNCSLTDDPIDDICRRYDRVTRAMKKLEEEMEAYQAEMARLKEIGDWARFGHVLSEADILAKSISITRREIERYEAKLAYEMQDGRPFSGVVESPSYCY